MHFLSRNRPHDTIMCLQEPWITQRGISKLPQTHEAFWIENGAIRPRTAIITPKRLGGYLVTHRSHMDCTTVRVLRGNLSIVSLYCDGHKSVRESWQAVKDEISQNERVIICADANATHAAWGGGRGHPRGRARGKETLDIIEEENLCICNKDDAGPTFIGAGDRRSNIDITCCTVQCLRHITDWDMTKVDFGSDHRTIEFFYQKGGGSRFAGPLAEIRTPWKRPTKRGREMMEKYLTQKVPQRREVNSSKEIQSYWTKHQADIVRALEELFPARKNRRTTRCYWWTPQVEEAHREYQTARGRMRREAKRMGGATEESKKAVKIERGRWRKELKIAKVRSWQDFTSNISDPWSGIHKVLKATSVGRGRDSTLRDEHGAYGEDILVTLQMLAKQFFPPLPPATDEHRKMEDHVNNLLNDVQEVPEIGVLEYRTALGKMAENSAPGMDRISTNVIRILSNGGWEKRYRKLFTRMLEQAYVPAEWKVAKIVQIPKAGGTQHTIKSVRPISLTAIHCKLLERILKQRLEHELETAGLMAINQHAYRKGGSTLTALYEAVHFIESATERKWICQAVFLDISGAFDRAWHAGMLYELLGLGVSPYLARWLRSYLDGRTAILEAGGTKHEVRLTRGCPQGGVLSPLLWNALFNRFLLLQEDAVPAGAPPIQIIGYADDALVLCQARSAASAAIRLTRFMVKIKKWADTYRVVFNPAKMATMTFGTVVKGRPAGSNSGVKFGCIDIQVVEQYKYLGVLLDSKLKWRAQAEACLEKVRNITRIFRGCIRESWGVKTQILRLLYEAILKPTMTYALPVWAAGVQTKVMKAKFNRAICDYVLMATRTFKTVARDVALQLMGVKPFEDVLEEELMRVSILQLKLNTMRVMMDGNRGVTRSMQIMRRSWMMLEPDFREMSPINLQDYYKEHPTQWYQPECKYDDRIAAIWNSIPNAGWIIYTDGAASSYGLGWATAVYRHGFLKEVKWGSLPRTSVFNAELYALSQALQQIKEIAPNKHEVIEIRTDAMACVRAIEKCVQVDQNLRMCWTMMREMREEGYKIVIRWTPGHHGNEGNELADRFAKAAVDSNNEGMIMVTERDAKRMINKKVEMMRAARFNNIKSSTFRKVFSNAASVATFRHTVQLGVLYQMVSGHCRLNHFLQKIGVAESTKCACGYNDENMEHYLCECPQYSAIREDIWGSESTKWEEVMDGNWRKIEDFVMSTGRLQWKQRDD